uniref:Uncharacterized protein n=1 Tax=Anguilla anguilla TaxID=7936 RepID=A0A0E9Q8K0_ANGAN
MESAGERLSLDRPECLTGQTRVSHWTDQSVSLDRPECLTGL